MKRHQHQIKGCQGRNGILFLWNVTQITLEALPLEKGQLYNEEIVFLNFFSYIFNWIYSLFRYNSQQLLRSAFLPISSSMRAIDHQFHLPCVQQKMIMYSTSSKLCDFIQMTCNMKLRMDFKLTIGKEACGEYLTSGLVGFGCFEKSSRLGLRRLAIQNLG